MRNIWQKEEEKKTKDIIRSELSTQNSFQMLLHTQEKRYINLCLSHAEDVAKRELNFFKIKKVLKPEVNFFHS